MAMMLTKSRTLIKTLIPNSFNFKFQSITTFPFFNQQPLFAEQPLPPPSPLPQPSSLPPNPSTGSPLYQQNWRSPIPATGGSAVIPLHLHSSSPSIPNSKDINLLMNQFADWVMSQRWGDIKDSFEQWVGSLDKNGKPNRPNVELFNQYLRAHLMCGASPLELLKVVEQMELYAVEPITASYNLVLRGVRPEDWTAAVSLLERMLQSGKQSQPDDASFELVIGLLFRKNQIEDALKYVDLALKSGCTLSSRAFEDCIRCCISRQKFDFLVSIIEKCKTMDQNKALSPDWNLSNILAKVASRFDNSKLAFLAFGFMAKLIQRGENGRPTIYLSVDETQVIRALSTAARTYDSILLDASWAILKRSLREKKAPNPETYLAKINALSSLGNLPSAFSTLSELEKNHGNCSIEAEQDLLSPFTSLHPLVVACASKGHETLDVVYFQLENLARADPPYKSVAALNCVVLGCANIWDLDRAYQTFEAISSSFGLTPNIHSYNGLLYAFGKLGKTEEAARVFEHLSSLGLKPNPMSYSLLIDAHLVNRDLKAALAALKAMGEAGFVPSRVTLLKIRRRCRREMDRASDDVVESVARQFNIVLGSETRRNILFNMEYSTEFTQ